MWNLIKGSYSATRELVRFLDEGKDLLGKGLNEFGKGIETLSLELNSMSKGFHETSTFKLYISRLELCRLTIEIKQKSTPTRYENLHHFYNLCKETIDASIDFLQMTIDKPNIRHLVLNSVDELKANIASISNEDEECNIELEEMYSKGLDRDANLLEAFYYYLETTSNDELAKTVKPILPNLINNFNLATKKLDHLRRRIAEFDK